jgi:phage antirepressor YoqD-like protein
LDAESTLRNSAQPKVQYTINVIEVSTQEGYEHFAYSLGDITHIQDTEFFGWTIKNGRKTPYKEKIVVTETTTNFDSPEKDTIKV